MAQKEMTRITEERISEIISRIEMYGHGAGYTADEVLEIAQQMLALRQKEQHESNTCRLNFEQWLEQQRGKIDVDCGCVSTETFMHWLRVAYEAGNYPDSSAQAPGKGGFPGERFRIKPHVYRELVNRLHDTAIKCAGTQQLRERISRVLGEVITPDRHKQAEKSGLERSHLEAALNIKPGHTLGVIDAMLVHEMAKALLPLEAD
ncbi:TPA: hypothetical protein ACIX0X_002730 [Escherichia coli]|uniref:hypothetical protein n=1 Tax=Escherichia coli TaxID=562 RepID=UPI000DF21B92|nr:hypothetical protein [Escherichia coli]EHU9041941.1 hypothetical protein [Escherichia coli]RCX75442.1 hypothetical protein DTL27_26920 [Escherichia coli]